MVPGSWGGVRISQAALSLMDDSGLGQEAGGGEGWPHPITDVEAEALLGLPLPRGQVPPLAGRSRLYSACLGRVKDQDPPQEGPPHKDFRVRPRLQRLAPASCVHSFPCLPLVSLLDRRKLPLYPGRPGPPLCPGISPMSLSLCRRTDLPAASPGRLLDCYFHWCFLSSNLNRPAPSAPMASNSDTRACVSHAFSQIARLWKLSPPLLISRQPQFASFRA